MEPAARGEAVALERHPGEAELAELIRRARRGDRQAREELIRRNLRLVRSVVSRFRRTAVEEDDLFQLGCVGLVKAVDRFEPERGGAFSTYAVPYITGEILSFLRADRPVKVGRATQEKARNCLRLREVLTQELGREPTVAEVAGRLGIAEDEVVEALDALRTPVSLEAPLLEGDGEELRCEDTVAAPVEDHLERLALAEGLGRLPEVERQLIELRFFCQKTQAAAGQELGMSQPQICRLEQRALARLRRALA